MPRRRQFTGIASALLHSFVSRNNDVGGYWAIGLLCRHAVTSGAKRIAIDLMAETLSPPSTRLASLPETWASHLNRQCAAQRIPMHWLFAAGVEMEVLPEYRKGEHPYACHVTLTDDNDKPHGASTMGFCRPHDPARESKSTREQSRSRGWLM